MGPLPNPTGQSPRAAVPVSNARAAASRKNGARSRGPRTDEGKARSAQNALKHGMRAQKYVLLPDEDGAEFADLEAALVAELAPVGALQTVLARRGAVAAWRLARADRIEVELFAERSWGPEASPGLALIRDGNGTRSFETLLRYRGAAMAEFMRALRTLKALQGRAGARDRSRPGGAPRHAGGTAIARPSCAAERTRARRRAPAGIRLERAARSRPHPARARRPLAAARRRLDAERTRGRQRAAGAGGARIPNEPEAPELDPTSCRSSRTRRSSS